MKVEWLYRSLIVGPYLALVLSSEEFHRALDHCRIPKADRASWMKTEHSNATSTYLENPDGELVCVVALRVKEGVTGVQIAALLVHEAVHVWQQFCERIGEDKPSAEFEAYSIQSIAQALMQAYADRTAKETA
jgi:hypothetical protein